MLAATIRGFVSVSTNSTIDTPIFEMRSSSSAALFKLREQRRMKYNPTSF